MDTRSKIIDAGEAARIAASGATVVSGYFDPLTASNAGRIANIERNGAKLLVLIATPENPILSARARAELVASLGGVDYVAEWAPGLDSRIRFEEEDKRDFEALVKRVHAKRGAAS